MPGDYLPDDLKNLWQELETKPLQLSPEQIGKETEALRKGVSRRSLIGGAACGILIVSWVLFFFISSNALLRIGSILTVTGTAYMVVQLRMRRARTAPDTGETDCATFYRAELERHRDFHRGKWFWSRVVMFLPGPVIGMVGFERAYPKLAAGIHLELAAFLIVAVIGIPLNLRLARKYQRRIDALDRSRRNE